MEISEHIESKHSTTLIAGLQEGILKHISEVANGLKCECVCPACNKKLIARKGEKRSHHFAHYKNPECKFGAQTAIHLLAKEILEKSEKIKIPPIPPAFLNTEIEKTNDKFISHGEFQEISEEYEVTIDKVYLEKKLRHKFIPDVIIVAKDKQLIIEIAVTHFVGRQKIEKIKKEQISALDIDLSKVANFDSREELEHLIIENIKNKKWLYNHYEEKKVSTRRKQIFEPINRKNDDRWLHETWLRTHYQKPIRYIKRKDITSPTNPKGYRLLVVDNCPKSNREYKGRTYATVTFCEKCEYFLGKKENDKYIICNYDYHHRPANKLQELLKVQGRRKKGRGRRKTKYNNRTIPSAERLKLFHNLRLSSELIINH
jgi:hypothetical protein